LKAAKSESLRDRIVGAPHSKKLSTRLKGSHRRLITKSMKISRLKSTFGCQRVRIRSVLTVNRARLLHQVFTVATWRRAGPSTLARPWRYCCAVDWRTRQQLTCARSTSAARPRLEESSKHEADRTELSSTLTCKRQSRKANRIAMNATAPDDH